MGWRRSGWVMGLITGQAVLMAATLYVPRFGADVWQHGASLALTLVLVGAFWRPLARSRRFLGMGILAFTVLATASGFWLLYWKEGLRVDGLQDWGRWWHVFWSWIAMVFFFAHTWINRRAYVRFFQRTLASRAGAGVHFGTYAVLVAAFILTASPLGRDWFTNENYIPLSLYTWLVVVVPPYGLWSYLRARLRSGRPAPRLRRLFRLVNVRSWVDMGLVAMAVLVVASGVVLTFLDAPMDRLGLKYASKYWHVGPSVAFSAIVFVHSIHSWRAMRRHWRSYEGTPPQGARLSSSPAEPRPGRSGAARGDGVQAGSVPRQP